MHINIQPDSEADETRLYIDSQFIASWPYIGIDDCQKRVIENMLSKAYKVGMQAQNKKIRKLLGVES